MFDVEPFEAVIDGTLRNLREAQTKWGVAMTCFDIERTVTTRDATKKEVYPVSAFGHAREDVARIADGTKVRMKCRVSSRRNERGFDNIFLTLAAILGVSPVANINTLPLDANESHGAAGNGQSDAGELPF